MTGDKNWEGENAPDGTALAFHLGRAPTGAVSLQVVELMSDELVRDLEIEARPGMNRVQWDPRANPRTENQNQGPEVDAGVYGVRLTVGGEVQSTTVTVLERSLRSLRPLPMRVHGGGRSTPRGPPAARAGSRPAGPCR